MLQLENGHELHPHARLHRQRSINMSWMDSWSRPSKHAATPPPLYSLPGGEATPYCHSCGRVIGSRRTQTSKTSQTVKYCAERCRHNKPGPTDHIIEETFVSLLNGQEPAFVASDQPSTPAPSWNKEKIGVLTKSVKGDPRLTVLCGIVEELVFGSRYNAERTFGRKKNRAKRGIPETGEWRSVDMEDPAPPASDYASKSQIDGEEEGSALIPSEEHEDTFLYGAGKGRSALEVSDLNFGVGGEPGWTEKIEETDELKQKRLQGQKKAEEREAVRCAARRLCAFGITRPEAGPSMDEESGAARRKQKNRAQRKREHEDTGPNEKAKKCEAVLKDGSTVEASFAKGDWGIRWRE